MFFRLACPSSKMNSGNPALVPESLDETDLDAKIKFDPKLAPPIDPGVQAARSVLTLRASDIMNEARASTTTSAYSKLMDSTISVAERCLELKLTPPASWDAVILLFTWVLEYGPRSRPLDRADLAPVVRWTYMRSVKAAWAHWHLVNNLPFIMDGPWPAQVTRFWQGLKRASGNTPARKTPLQVIHVKKLLVDAAAIGPQLIEDLAPGKPFAETSIRIVKIRCAVSVALAFFCIKRFAEISALRLGDLMWGPNDTFVRLSIRRQKNDQEGVGAVACLPNMSSWGSACPVRMLRLWISCRAEVARLFDKHDRIATSPALDLDKKDSVFITLKGPNWGRLLSPDACAAQLQCLMPVPYSSLPSPRKGGARRFAILGTPRVITQAQGNWKTPAVMTSVYDGFEEQEHLREVVLAAARGQDAIAFHECLQDLTSDAFSKDSIAASADHHDLHETISKLHSLRHLLSRDAIAQVPDLAKRLRIIRDLSDGDTRGMTVEISYACGLIKKRARVLDSSACSSAMARADAQGTAAKSM